MGRQGQVSDYGRNSARNCRRFEVRLQCLAGGTFCKRAVVLLWTKKAIRQAAERLLTLFTFYGRWPYAVCGCLEGLVLALLVADSQYVCLDKLYWFIVVSGILFRIKNLVNSACEMSTVDG